MIAYGSIRTAFGDRKIASGDRKIACGDRKIACGDLVNGWSKMNKALTGLFQFIASPFKRA